MPKKNERKTAVHILTLLEENKGTGMRLIDISEAMYKKGYRHNRTSAIDNLRFLVEHKKIVKVLTCYGIPTEKDGKKYLTVKLAGQKATMEIE